jgi:hypothetical protein
VQTEELFFLGSDNAQVVLAEENDLFESTFDIFIFLDGVQSVVNIGFVVRLRLDQFFQAKIFGFQIYVHEKGGE